MSGFVLYEIVAMRVVVGPISSLLTILLRKRFVRSQFVLPMLPEESTIKATSAALLQSGAEKKNADEDYLPRVFNLNFCVSNDRHFPIFFNAFTAIVDDLATPFFSEGQQSCSSQRAAKHIIIWIVKLI